MAYSEVLTPTAQPARTLLKNRSPPHGSYSIYWAIALVATRGIPKRRRLTQRL